MTYISWSSDFALYLRLFDVCISYFGSMNQYDQMFDLKINVPWSNDFALYLEDYLMHEHYYLAL